MKEEIDKTIEVVCKTIQSTTCTYEDMMGLIQALAELVTARANLEMAVRVRASGSTGSTKITDPHALRKVMKESIQQTFANLAESTCDTQQEVQ